MGIFSRKDVLEDKAKQMESVASLGGTLIWDALYETDSDILISEFKIEDVRFFITVGIITLYIRDLLVTVKNSDGRRFGKLVDKIKKNLTKEQGDAYLDCTNFINVAQCRSSEDDYYLTSNWIVWNLLRRKPESITEKKLVTNINALLPISGLDINYWTNK
jgi:hypothetical protein